MATRTVTTSRDLGGGIKLVVGTIDMVSTYVTGGATVDMSGEFPKGTVHYLAAGPGNGAGGYFLDHNGGTATAGKIMAYREDNSTYASDTNLAEVTSGVNLAALSAVYYIAFGE